MEHMFHGCQNLEDINISNFNLENVISTSSMFQGCLRVKNINFNGDTLTEN